MGAGLGDGRLLGPLLLICGAGGGSYPKRVMRMGLVVTDSMIEAATERAITVSSGTMGRRGHAALQVFHNHAEIRRRGVARAIREIPRGL